MIDARTSAAEDSLKETKLGMPRNEMPELLSKPTTIDGTTNKPMIAEEIEGARLLTPIVTKAAVKATPAEGMTRTLAPPTAIVDEAIVLIRHRVQDLPEVTRPRAQETPDRLTPTRIEVVSSL